MSRETILSLLNKSAGFFEEKGISEARLSAELLLARSLGYKRMDLYLRFEQPVVEEELEVFRSMVRRRLKNEPVQYILGETEFYGLPFAVTPAVLIPRPETEHLVERVIELANASHELANAAVGNANDAGAKILDIGTGSGIIPVAVAKHVAGASLTAIDISSEALAIARENAGRNDVAGRIEFLEADVLEISPTDLGGQYDFIVSNPPYIPRAEVADLQPEIREYEPLIAATDGGDGLTFYKRIADISTELLRPEGKILIEIGFGQADSVSGIFTSAGFNVDEIIEDYSGIARILVISFLTTP